MTGNLTPRYFDGETSVPKDVSLSMTDQSLLILKDGVRLDTWAYANIHVKEDWLDEAGVLLGLKDKSYVSLAVYNRKQYEAIITRLQHKHRASFLIPHQYRHLFLLTFVAIATVILIFPLLNDLARLGTYLVPLSAEKKLGGMVITDMEDEFKVCDDKVAMAHLHKISNRLLMAADKKNVALDIHLFKSSTPNAFSIPGHKIAVLSGFLNDAESENEIAAVMAHEMGHMVNRDALEAFIEVNGINILTSLMSSSGSYGGVAQFTSMMQTMDYSRKKEFMADEFGAKLTLKAGYSPIALGTFLTRMDKEHPVIKGSMKEYQKYLEIFSTHPNTNERVARLKNFGGPKAYKPSLTPAEFGQLKNACKTLPVKEENP